MIIVNWSALTKVDARWNYCRCLYAYLSPTAQEILYIGKAWGKTIRDRWDRSAKSNFWYDLENMRQIRHHIVLIGEVSLPIGESLTRELLYDIETLLISVEKPWGNIQSRNSRIRRPGMHVKCTGKWLGKRKIYKDE